MNSKPMSEASTYCSEAETMQQFNVQFNDNVRRSQRLREKSDRNSQKPQNANNENAEWRTDLAGSPDVFQSSFEPSFEVLPPAQENALNTASRIEKTKKTGAVTVNRKKNELSFASKNRTCGEPIEKKPRSNKKVQRQKSKNSSAPQNENEIELKKSARRICKSKLHTTERAFQDISNINQKSEQSNCAAIPPIERYYIHPNEQRIKPSVLPHEYPPHFLHQLPPLNSTTNDLSKNKDSKVKADENYKDLKFKELCSSPDSTESLCQEVNILPSNDNSSRTPSLPDSVCEALGTKNLRDLLNIAPIRYRLTEEHLNAVAIILNIEEERMQSVIDLVMSLPQGQVISIATSISKSASGIPVEMADLVDKNSECSAQFIENSQEHTVGASRHFTSQRFN